MTAMRKTLTLGMAAGAVLVLAGCSRQQPDLVGSQSDGIPRHEVLISHMSFIPRTITVKAGTTVTWVWADGPTFDNVVFDSDGLHVNSGNKRTGTFSYTFSDPGTYNYSGTLHQNMSGRVVVTP
jgi:plastocyanin